MRNSMISILLLATSSTAAVATPADTYGAPSARELTATLHSVHHTYTRDPRAFVLLGDPAPADVELARIDRHSYDATSVARAAPLAAPRTFTIVTDQGACTVSSADQVWIAPWGSHPQRAIEIDAAACGTNLAPFALDDELPIRSDRPRTTANAGDLGTWIEQATHEHPGTAADGTVQAWSQELPLTRIVAIEVTLGTTSTLLLRRDDQLVAQLAGAHVVGELRWGSRDYAIITEGSGLRAVRL